MIEIGTELRRRVLDAVLFPEFDPDDPIFELDITRALAVTWPAPGRSEKRAWRTD
ncbi:MAG: hypothetical protein QGI55_18240 [Pseudomonadales bacterium]|nr:hypothetical protein [Pseudomonadales bacterium]